MQIRDDEVFAPVTATAAAGFVVQTRMRPTIHPAKCHPSPVKNPTQNHTRMSHIVTVTGMGFQLWFVR